MAGVTASAGHCADRIGVQAGLWMAVRVVNIERKTKEGDYYD